jgi:ACR3 family arsenite transporter
VITLTINWLIKPFTMAALAVLFFEYLFADLINRVMLSNTSPA